MTTFTTEVTRQELVLDSQNTATGWFNTHYNDSVIDAILQPKGVNLNVGLDPGKFAKYDTSMLTADYVKESDRITDKAGVQYQILTVEPYPMLSEIAYYTCGLEKLINCGLSTSAYAAAALESPSNRTLTWFTAYLAAANLPDYIAAYSYPTAYTLLDVFREKNIDLVFSVENGIATADYNADKTVYGYSEEVPVTISAIDKDISGKALVWQAETELRALCEDHAFGSLRLMKNSQPKPTRYGTFTVYSSEFTLIYRRKTE